MKEALQAVSFIIVFVCESLNIERGWPYTYSFFKQLKKGRLKCSVFKHDKRIGLMAFIEIAV